MQLQCVKMGVITSQISRSFAFHSIRNYAKSGAHFVEGRTKSLRRLQILGYVRNISVEKRTLSGKIEVISCGVPTIFDPKQSAAERDPRKERKNKRDRRAQHTETCYARRNLQWKTSLQPLAKKLKLALMLKEEESKWFKTC